MGTVCCDYHVVGPHSSGHTNSNSFLKIGTVSMNRVRHKHLFQLYNARNSIGLPDQNTNDRNHGLSFLCKDCQRWFPFDELSASFGTEVIHRLGDKTLMLMDHCQVCATCKAKQNKEDDIDWNFTQKLTNYYHFLHGCTLVSKEASVA